ncbi:MAG: DNA repair protein RadA [Chitinivibrionales bacterium]|nr:DNA repair protein RadA [Chitinivibrionales bacterium]MBD3396780.1 DNA repair protein RadA [Chitinivibrionales bacterium]
MAKKAKTFFVCNNCGQEFTKWQGRCHSCGEWKTVVEFKQPARRASPRPAGAGAGPVHLSSCRPEQAGRITTGFPEMDRVLGGGLVAGGVLLLGGDPGIGKSTLLLQLCAKVASAARAVLYVSGEESAEQIGLRARRLEASRAEVQILTETGLEPALHAMRALSPAVAVVDSIQTMFTEELESAPGSVSQVRECGAMLLRFAKENGCIVFLVGHVTKEGAIAGPRILEHMVDTVLYFEGDTNYQYRLLRAVKNRFGPSGELALFSMHDKGLAEVADCADFFVLNRDNPQVGSAFVPVREGSRILAVELQALVNQSHFGMPQRVASGINQKKLALVLAVLERYGGLALGDHDIFFNVAGGLTIHEPAADLGIAAAVLSSFRNAPLRTGLALVGEVGLGGEIRPVNGMSARLKELASMGFSHCVVPEPSPRAEWASHAPPLELLPLKHIRSIGGLILD